MNEEKGHSNEHLRRGTYYWASITPDELCKTLGVNPEMGHTKQRVQELLKEKGLNVLPSPKGIIVKQIKTFLLQILETTQILLIIMGVVSLLLETIATGCMLLSLAVVNYSVSFLQYYRYTNLAKKLRTHIPQLATVIRDGHISKIPSEELVMGDVVCLQTGEIVPADLRIIKSEELRCVESTLTGEPAEVSKIGEVSVRNRQSLGTCENMVFMSSNIVSGSARCIVIATGKDTQLAKISTGLMSFDVKLTTPSDRLLKKIYFLLLYSSAIVIVAILAYNKFAFSESAVKLSINIIMAALPTGLRTVLLVMIYSSGNFLLKKSIVTRQLKTLELMGYTNTLFCDKTGTITTGEMTIVAVWTLSNSFIYTTGRGIDPVGNLTRHKNLSNESSENFSVSDCINNTCNHEQLKITEFDTLTPDEQLLIIISSLCNSSFIEPSPSDSSKNKNMHWKGIGSPTEIALRVLSYKISAYKPVLENSGWSIIREIPFSGTYKFMSVIVKSPDGKFYLLTKGSAEKLLTLSTLSPTGPLYNRVIDKIESLGKHSLRLIAFSYKLLSPSIIESLTTPAALTTPVDLDICNGSTFIGLAAIHDALRLNASSTFSTLERAGISITIITGDSKITSIETAKNAGLLNRDISPAELTKQIIYGGDLEKLSDAELAKFSRPKLIYRCTPKLKLRIVRNMKDANYRCAVIGDGLNDAASVKAADVGISMGTLSSEITRAAADIILLNNNFNSVVDLVKEGRGLCWRLRYFLVYYSITALTFLLCCIAAIHGVISGSRGFVVIITSPTIIVSYIVSTIGGSWFFYCKPPMSIMESKPKHEKKLIFSLEDIADMLVGAIVSTLCSICPFFIVYYSYYYSIESSANSSPVACHLAKSADELSTYCQLLYRSRSPSSFIFVMLLLISAVHCRSSRKSEWGLSGLKTTFSNRPVVLASIGVFVFLILTTYIDSIGINVMYQTSIKVESIYIPIFLAMNIILIEIYKFIKRKCLGADPDLLNATL